MTSQPIQPIKLGRFVPNKIVQFLLDHGGIDMNYLARQNFTDEDSMQFAQLIGYSLSGYGGLSYVSDESYEAAEAMIENPELLAAEARNIALNRQLNEVRDHIKAATCSIFKNHPDDFQS